MSQISQFAGDLFRDLRDRRLLIPVVALVVALIAVPMLLSRSESPAVPPPPPSAAASEPAATEAAVLTETVTVRDYRKRLDALKSKNPFEEHFSLPPEGGGGGGGGGLGGIGDAPPSSSFDSPTGTSAPPTDTPPATSSSSGGGSSSGDSPPPNPPEPRFYEWRVDVDVGPAGDAVERNGVSQLTLLPSRSKPVMAFLGIGENGTEAVFAVANDVTEATGSGKCIPRRSNCAYVSLDEGEQMVLDYAPDDVSYRIRLREIRLVRIQNPGKVGGTL